MNWDKFPSCRACDLAGKDCPRGEGGGSPPRCRKLLRRTVSLPCLFIQNLSVSSASETKIPRDGTPRRPPGAWGEGVGHGVSRRPASCASCPVFLSVLWPQEPEGTLSGVRSGPHCTQGPGRALPGLDPSKGVFNSCWACSATQAPREPCCSPCTGLLRKQAPGEARSHCRTNQASGGAGSCLWDPSSGERETGAGQY